MQEPLEGISFNFDFICYAVWYWTSGFPASIAESFQERDLARATASGSSGHSLSNAETLELSSQLVDTKWPKSRRI